MEVLRQDVEAMEKEMEELRAYLAKADENRDGTDITIEDDDTDYAEHGKCSKQCSFIFASSSRLCVVHVLVCLFVCLFVCLLAFSFLFNKYDITKFKSPPTIPFSITLAIVDVVTIFREPVSSLSNKVRTFSGLIRHCLGINIS